MINKYKTPVLRVCESAITSEIVFQETYLNFKIIQQLLKQLMLCSSILGVYLEGPENGRIREGLL